MIYFLNQEDIFIYISYYVKTKFFQSASLFALLLLQ